MKTYKIKNNAYYDRTFFGREVDIKAESDEVITKEEFGILNKNCPNFQQMTNPPEHGGNPRIRVLGSTPDDKVRLNAERLGNPTRFTAPEVRLKANGENSDGITEIPESKYNKLQDNEKFKKLVKSGDLEVLDD